MTTSEQQARYRRKVQDFIDYMKSVPCADCGVLYPPYVMDFDHRPDEEKLFQIGDVLAKGVSLERLLDEIAKCDVVCANCHRERTHARKEG